jgi:hypothetical protein
MYRHRYHQSLVYKIFMADKQGPKVYVAFAEVLAFIREVHAFSRGVRQIVYLAGWQFDGHDSKYPAWTEVNARLKRNEDATALDSLLWLMREAKRYNAVVSIHINMDDAYDNSPLWKEYVERDLIVREADGSLRRGALWGGEQSYVISKKREWASGLARQRIDGLLRMLPLQEAGTVHIDVLAPRESPGHGITLEEDSQALRQILEYWKAQGVDVTKEWYHHDYRGLVPMVYHLNLDERSRLQNPPDVICGGGPAWNKRGFRFYDPITEIKSPAPFGAPEAGCLHEEAWGYSIDDDVSGLADLGKFKANFFSHTVPWLFLNGSTPVKHVQTADRYEVHFEGGAISAVAGGEATHTITRDHQLLKEGGAYCLPAEWVKDTLVAYSREDIRRRWSVPEGWKSVEIVSARQERRTQPVKDGWIEVELKGGEPIWISPAEAAGAVSNIL